MPPRIPEPALSTPSARARPTSAPQAPPGSGEFSQETASPSTSRRSSAGTGPSEAPRARSRSPDRSETATEASSPSLSPAPSVGSCDSRRPRLEAPKENPPPTAPLPEEADLSNPPFPLRATTPISLRAKALKTGRPSRGAPALPPVQPADILSRAALDPARAPGGRVT